MQKVRYFRISEIVNVGTAKVEVFEIFIFDISLIRKLSRAALAIFFILKYPNLSYSYFCLSASKHFERVKQPPKVGAVNK